MGYRSGAGRSRRRSHAFPCHTAGADRSPVPAVHPFFPPCRQPLSGVRFSRQFLPVLMYHECSQQLGGELEPPEGAHERWSLPVSLPEQNLSPCLCTRDKCVLPRRDRTRSSSKGQAPFRGTKVRAQGIEIFPVGLILLSLRQHVLGEVALTFPTAQGSCKHPRRWLPRRSPTVRLQLHLRYRGLGVLGKSSQLSVSLGAATGPARTEAGECTLQFPPS